jgi:hypothetical protein
MADNVQSGQTRVWLIKGGAAPDNVPQYMGWYRINDPTWGQGDVTPIKVPSGDRYNEFEEVDSVEGAKERPTFGITGLYTTRVSDLVKLARKGCDNDIQAHIGKCANPQDFNRGWEKVVVFPNARVTSLNIENFGALSDDEKNPTRETGEMSAKELYEIVRLAFSDILGAVAVREITAIAVCDTVSCGECGDESDGCQKIFFGMDGAAATPGTDPIVIYSDDGGATGGVSTVDPMFSNEIIDDMACAGGYLIIASELGGIVYVDISDLLAGVGVWTEVETGLVVGSLPYAVVAYDVSHIWFAADNGYIYFSDDITAGVVVQDAGVATTQNLKAIDAYDAQSVVAVGDLNAVIYTINGGQSWQAVVGPAVGENLTAVVMKNENKWLVSTNTALYRTEDAGANWTQINLPIIPVAIGKIRFANNTVGYMAVIVAGPEGRILRTIDGGRSWYVLPEATGAIPDNEAITVVAACKEDVNVVWGAGVETGTTGIIVKAVGS